MLTGMWEPSDLPEDRIRLALNISSLMDAVGISLDEAKKLLAMETDDGRGARTLNLSPFSAIVQCLLNQHADKVATYLRSGDNRFKIFLPDEVTLPEGLALDDCANAVRPSFT